MKKLITLLTFVLIILQINAQNRDWSIVASYQIPGKASGLAWDGTFIYYGIYGAGGDQFYKFDPNTGNASLLFTNPAIDDSYGMTYDGTNLWIVDQPSSSSNPSLATEIDINNGNIISTIPLADHYMSGIAYDNGDFWVGTYYPDPGVIYHISSFGTVLSQFAPPDEQTWDICTDGDDLWIVDYYANMIYKTDQNGAILEQHPCENIKPSGIVHDGTYLWYCDGQLSSPSTLYKVDLGGTGTPEINVPVRLHDYGTITLGNSSTWNMMVQNTGTANLIVTGLTVLPDEPLSTTMSFPQTITPGNSILIPIKYQPTVIGPMNTVIYVNSSDPINPQVSVTMVGEGVYSGPSLEITTSSHDYGLVRKDAFTRWFLKIKNVGDQTLNIAEVNSDSPNFIVDQDFIFPHSIQTLDSVLIGIWFNPTDGSAYGGMLEVLNNDPTQNPFNISLSGEGNPQEWPIGDPLWYYNINTSWDNSPKAIISINDVTNDSVADVIICSEDNYVRCFNGNSSGLADIMWETFIYSGSVPYQSDLDIIDDIDGDTFQDVIIGTAGGDRSIIALSGKTGAIIWKHQTNEYGDGGWVYQVDCSYDFNEDGVNDVIAATGDDSQDQGPKRVYCLDGSNGETIWDCFTGGPNFSAIGVRDFNGDNIPDAIGGASNANETEGKVYGIDGASGNIEWTYDAGGSSVWALNELTPDNDLGSFRIIAGDFGGNFYIINPEDGSLIHPGSLGSTIILEFAKLDDVNGDGYPDVIPGYSGTNGIVISGMDASNIWFISLADKAWNVARIGDISGDGINDVIIGTLFSDNYCYFMNGVNGDMLHEINYNQPVDAINSIPDIVGDHSMEMVAGGREGKVYCYSGGLNTATGINEEQSIGENELAVQIFPNPANHNSTLTIEYQLNESGNNRISLLDIYGREVYLIEETYKQIGLQTVNWNIIPSLTSGVYLLKVETGNNVIVEKLTIK
ncbi:choice-of-anchor D domain-containing protein [Bacteroidota bacterium]